MADDKEGKLLEEGYTPTSRGHEPRKVQGGFVPKASAHPGPIKPPRWGSAAKPPSAEGGRAR